MKNKFLKLLVGVLTLSVFCTASFADQYSSNSVAAGLTSLVTVGGNAREIVLANATGSTVTVQLIDAPTNSLTYTLGSYVSTTRSQVSVTNIYTDVLGKSVTNIYPATQLTTVTNAASTNNYATVISFAIPANSTTTFRPVGNEIFARGLLMTNNGTVSVTINYDKITP